MSFPRCASCPIVGPCAFEWTGHRPYCDWAVRGGALLTRVRELSAAGPVGPEPVLPGLSVAESIALTRAMNRCPWRCAEGCGCSGARCFAGMGRKGMVNHRDCFACIATFSTQSEAIHGSN